MYYKKIVGNNLYLSPCDINNEVEIMTKWMNEDEDIAINNGFYAYLFNENKVRETLEKWNEGPYMFSLVNNDDEFMGHLSLMDPVIANYATLSIYIGKKYRQKGYFKEAMNLVKDYAFNTLDLKTIRLEVFAYNKNAIKAYLAVGFKECGRWHNSRYYNGQYHDVVLMELIRE